MEVVADNNYWLLLNYDRLEIENPLWQQETMEFDYFFQVVYNTKEWWGEKDKNKNLIWSLAQTQNLILIVSLFI
jgi:hypothetical protein